MDWGFIILIILLLGWGAIVYWINYKSKKGNSHTAWTPTHQTPYEKYISEHVTDFNVRWQRSQVVKHRESLNEALKSGNRIAAKVHRGMIVYGRSVVNHLLNKFNT